jgi:hypothetical protein
MPTIAGYEYTGRDVANTLRPMADWWTLLAHGRAVDDSFVELRRRAGEVMVDPSIGDAERLERSLHLLDRAGQVLRSAGAFPATASGSVVQLNVSGGGVPKRPVASVEVTRGGVAGDKQKHRQHHGRPWQALCLWSAEVIDAFAADGHPIGYGSAGENVTIRGIDWSTIGPGVRLRIGSVLAECSLWTLPCAHNKQWFRDGDFNLMHHEGGPVSRMYAWVRETGRIDTGAPVVVEP